MIQDKPHIIRKVQAELTIPSKERHREQSERLQQAIQNVFQNLESVLDEAAGEFLHKIDSLTVELTLQTSDLDRLEEHLEEAVKAKILELIASKSTDIDVKSEEVFKRISWEESYLQILSSFLETGYLPWWVEPAEFAKTEEWMRDLPAQEWISFLRSMAKNQPMVVRRFVLQFSDSSVDRVIQKIVAKEFGDDQIIRLRNEILRFARSFNFTRTVYSKVEADLQSKIIEGVLLEHVAEKLSEDLLRFAIKDIGMMTSTKTDNQSTSENLSQWLRKSEHPNSERWIENLEKISGNTDRIVDREKSVPIDKKQNQKQRKTNSNPSNNEEGLSITHAGIVILHPFFESLFKNLGFIENGDFLNESAREHAVCLIHYLATGEEEFPEYELLLPKFLCSWPIDLPINRYLKITEPEMEECKSVLSSCIQHWESLKNTSVDGLRNNFLQRDGILKKEEFGWSLYIEQKTMDILLGRLPWNLSIIKLKWMDEMLTVHWQ